MEFYLRNVEGKGNPKRKMTVKDEKEMKNVVRGGGLGAGGRHTHILRVKENEINNGIIYEIQN